jgi:hypothetical protein
MTEKQRWSAKHNPSLQTRKWLRWIARRDAKAVGRIVGAYDPAFAERWQPATGFVGFFECEDDAEAARAMIEAAHAWLRSLALTSVMGPINLSTNDEVGLLVDGFDSPPTLLSPYNPPRYAAYFHAAGYEKKRDYYAYRWNPALDLAPAVERIGEAARRQTGNFRDVRVRHPDVKRWEEETRTLFRLYNEAFAGVWGFVPMSWNEFSARAGEFKPFYHADFGMIAEVDGEAAGFGLVLPDINVALRRVNGRLLPLGWLRLLVGIRRLRTGRFILAGVLPKFASRGLGPVIAYELSQAHRRTGFGDIEISLVQETNARMLHMIDAFGCVRTKTYRLFERAL